MAEKKFFVRYEKASQWRQNLGRVIGFHSQDWRRSRMTYSYQLSISICLTSGKIMSSTPGQVDKYEEHENVKNC